MKQKQFKFVNIIMKYYKNTLIIIAIFFLSIVSSCGQTPTIKNKNTSSFEVNKPDDQWKKELSKDQYYILRQKGTEKPYSGKFYLHKEKGKYYCAACGNELFSSDAKFDSDCGWPSFDGEIGKGRIIKKQDLSYGANRTEIICAKCGGHLGHLFNDGPTSSGLRYCVNSGALAFGAVDDINTVKSKYDTICLAGGCYWCVEAIYEKVNGVVSAESGFSGGKNPKADYRMVSSGKTGHAEVVQIVFDTDKISLALILKVFFSVHDPTTLNRQGADVGTQYRSEIFYRNQAHKILAEEIINSLKKEKVYDAPIVTQVSKFEGFIKADESDQNYYFKNEGSRYCKAVIQPKIEKFEKAFSNLLKSK